MSAVGRLLIVASACATAVAAQAGPRDFDIPGQAATLAIPEFARQAGVQIIAPADALGGLTTARLRGRLEPRVALRRLIAGLPLEIASDDGRTWVLRAAAPPLPAAEIVVTGSRIRSPVIEPPASVISLAATELASRYGGISLGDQLSLLPPLRTSATQSATAAVGGQASGQVGLNLLDLRGLGPSRTLVLVDGRRQVTSTQLVSQPDINTIPAALLERVDILTGGASAVYGADAIAGVVNFVLKQDFTGLAVDAQSGISARGDAATLQIALVAGRTLGDGRGNLALALGHASRDHLRAASRDFAAARSDFVANPRAGQPGEPATIPARDLRSLTVSDGGTLAYGAPFLRFDAEGRLKPATVEGAAFPEIGLGEGGDGANPGDNASLLPRNQRVYGTLIGHYRFSNAVTLFAQADAVWQTAEAFAPPAIADLEFSRDNAFLSAEARATLAGFTPAANSATVAVTRTLDDIARLSERNTRTTLRGLVGLRGNLSAHLRYELSYSFGSTAIIKDNFGNIDLARLRLGVDAVADPAAPGGIGCAARLADPASRDPAIAGCVPIDIFGAGAPSQAARDYVGLTTRSTGRFAQHLAAGFVAGDTGGFLRLPGGPLRFVAGAELRRETTRYTPDPRDTRGSTLVAGQRLSGAIGVIEAFGEVTAPILADRAGAHRLELGGAIRASRYDLQFGTRINGGISLLYQPIPALTLRASVQRAMRAPNITELFQQQLAGTADVTDRCDARFIGDGTPARPGNCAALGIPADFTAPTVPTPVRTLTQGNPDLDVERGRTLTLGMVIAPAATGLRLAIDYHDIEISRAIAQPGTASLNAATIAAGCVDVARVPNDYCALVRRDAGNNRIGLVRLFPTNLTRLQSRGIDVDLRWRGAIGRGVRIDWRLLASHVLARDDFRVPAQPDYATRLAGTPSDPRWQVTQATMLAFGPASLFHRLRYQSPVYYRTDDVAFFESVNGLPPVNPNRRPADFIKTGDYWVHDLRLGLAVKPGCEFHFGIDNLLDARPPFGFTGAGSTGAQYDPVGRFFHVGIRTRL